MTCIATLCENTYLNCLDKMIEFAYCYVDRRQDVYRAASNFTLNSTFVYTSSVLSLCNRMSMKE